MPGPWNPEHSSPPGLGGGGKSIQRHLRQLGPGQVAEHPCFPSEA